MVGCLHWSRDGNMLSITGIEEGTTVMVYDIQGMLVEKVVPSNGEAHVQLPHKGVYILNAGSRQIKIR